MVHSLKNEKIRVFLNIIHFSRDKWSEKDIQTVLKVLEKSGYSQTDINALITSSFNMGNCFPFDFNGRFKILFNFIYFIKKEMKEAPSDLFYRMAGRLKFSMYELPIVIRIITTGIKQNVPERTVQESLKTCLKSTRVFMNGF